MRGKESKEFVDGFFKLELHVKLIKWIWNFNDTHKCSMYVYKEGCSYWCQLLQHHDLRSEVMTSPMSSERQGSFLTRLRHLAEIDGFLKRHLEDCECCDCGKTIF
jgi:hypothetical protein